MDFMTLTMIAQILLFIALVITYMCKHILTWRRTLLVTFFSVLSLVPCVYFLHIINLSSILQDVPYEYSHYGIVESIKMLLGSLFIILFTFLLFFLSKKLRLITISIKESLCLAVLCGCTPVLFTLILLSFAH